MFSFENINLAEITHPDDIEKSYEYMKHLLIGKHNMCKFEKRLVHRNCRIVWVELNVYLLKDAKDEPIYFIVNYFDITEKKYYEDNSLTENTRLLVALKSIDNNRNTFSQIINQVIEKLFTKKDYMDCMRPHANSSIQVII